MAKGIVGEKPAFRVLQEPPSDGQETRGAAEAGVLWTIGLPTRT
jgi:hypothetical protein